MNKQLEKMTEEINKETEWSRINATFTIVFGELVEKEYDWGQDVYMGSWSDDRRIKLNEYIINHFYYREISLVPLAKWRRKMISKLNLILPKYDFILNRIDDDINIFQDSLSKSKERNLHSDFPQSELKGDSDYATNSDDVEKLEEVEGNTLDTILKLYEEYESVQKKIIDELEVMFISVYGWWS